MTVTVAHPAIRGGSNNNGEEQKTTCKKVTGENPYRQPDLLRLDALDAALSNGHVTGLIPSVSIGPKHLAEALASRPSNKAGDFRGMNYRSIAVASLLLWTSYPCALSQTGSAPEANWRRDLLAWRELHN